MVACRQNVAERAKARAAQAETSGDQQEVERSRGHRTHHAGEKVDAERDGADGEEGGKEFAQDTEERKAWRMGYAEGPGDDDILTRPLDEDRRAEGPDIDAQRGEEDHARGPVSADEWHARRPS